MGDIVKAIEKEKEYIAYRLKNEEPFHLVDAVKECGFESLEEYFNAKRSYKFSKMEFTLTECKQSEIVSEAKRIIENGLTGVWFADSDETAVFNGFEGEKSFNAEYCSLNNLLVFPLLAAGGTIVHKAGDFSWGVSCPQNQNMNAAFLLNGVKDILQKHTEKTVTVAGNDILVDGGKVCGSTVYQMNGIFLFISYYSFSDKTELIKTICRKLTRKTPSYIDFMTRAEFKQEVAAWLKLSI